MTPSSTKVKRTCDICIIGGGIAGISAGAEMAGSAQVVVCEAEDQPGHHATGRSAARFAFNYGPPAIRALSEQSWPDFEGTGQQDIRTPFIAEFTGEIFVASAGQEAALAEIFEVGSSDLQALTADEIIDLQPLLKRDVLIGGAYDKGGGDIDVHAVLEHYRRLLLSRGGTLLTGARVADIRFNHGLWTVETAAGTIEAPRLVDAAGAWGDEVAKLAGVLPLGLTPKRRTAVSIDLTDRAVDTMWPAVIDAEERLYFKPDAGRLLVSPADETPSPPCDAQPEELDVAIAVDRLSSLTTVKVKRVAHRWAGLRTFTPDGTPAVGEDPDAPGFYWLVGQGGYGIQTSPAMARLAAALVLGQPVDPAIEPWLPDLAPNRFRSAASA